MEDINGVLNCFGENSTVSDILSSLVLSKYVLFQMWCSISGMM